MSTSVTPVPVSPTPTSTLPPAIPLSSAGQGADTPPSNPNGTLGQNDFLKLFVAQMRNQDPTNPMSDTDLAAQMAQFSSVEQLVNINQTLTNQSSSSDAIASAVNANVATAAIGKTIMATGNSVALQGTTGQVTFDVGGSGGTAVLTVTDANGNVVDTQNLGTIGSGRQTETVNAPGEADGAYTYAVSVTDSSGQPVSVTTYTVGTADSVKYTSSGPVIGAGPLSIPFGSIVEIGSTK